MKVVKNKEELLEYVSEDDAYDIDDHYQIDEIDYEYPIVVEYAGITEFGTAYKVRSRKDFEELLNFIREIM